MRLRARLTRVAREVGTDGRLCGQAIVPGVAGTWEGPHRTREHAGSHLTTQVRNSRSDHRGRARRPLAQVHRRCEGRDSRAQEHITRWWTAERVRGEVTRVARGGHEASIGGQAQCRASPGRGGPTDNVNVMAANLTERCADRESRDGRSPTGISAELTVRRRAKSPRSRHDQQHDAHAATLPDQVTSVAREVGVEGRLADKRTCWRLRDVEGPDRQRELLAAKLDRHGARSPTWPPR